MKYHLLLVDDEVHAIEGVKADLDLDKLDIFALSTAYNIRQAKGIIEKDHIDIMLCDIEMPQGNGLELLSWVKENHPRIVTILLTSHADFKYAKEALRLGSLDYLLKPVMADDLEQAIRKAQAVIDQHSEINRHGQSHQLWMKHHSMIIERFWLDLINHTIPSQPAAIRELIERHQLLITEQSMFLPIYISIQRWVRPLRRREERILEYALKKTAEEMLLGSQESGVCFYLGRGELLAIIVGDNKREWDNQTWREVFTDYIQFCSQHFYCELSCYFGRVIAVHEMADMVTELKNEDRNNVAFVNHLFLNEQFQRVDQPGSLPDLNVWLSLLKIGSKENIILEAEKLLDQLVLNRALDAQVLHQFHQDFMQALYSFLNMKEIQAHRFFGDEESRILAESALRSVKDMLIWIRHAASKALHQAEVVEAPESVVQIVRKYIAANIDQDLSREAIAGLVFLNPDYLSRLFKRETGLSLSDYVVQERIKIAKELLSQTNIPIGNIAYSVGYSNLSYFSKIFKKYTEMGPSEYRGGYGRKVKGGD